METLANNTTKMAVICRTQTTKTYKLKIYHTIFVKTKLHKLTKNSGLNKTTYLEISIVLCRYRTLIDEAHTQRQQPS